MLHTRILLPLLLVLSAFSVGGFAAEGPPTSEDVNTLAEFAKLTVNSFYQHTFEIRMRYEFEGRFFSENDRLALYDSARHSSWQLADIISRLHDTVRQIEQYEGRDWNQRFGRTGMYENASGQLFSIRASKFGIDYFAVLAAADKDVELAAKELLKQIDLFAESQDAFYLQLVKGKTLNLLAEIEPDYTQAAKKLFSQLRERSDTSQRLAFLASIGQIRLKSVQGKVEAERLARDLIKSKLTDDLEVTLPLAFLQRRLGLVDTYNDLLHSNPAARTFAAEITLAWLESGHEPYNPLDAALAAEAALWDGPEKHKELLLELARENTSVSPVVDYAAAVTLADGNEPQAAYLLIRASEVLDAQSAEVLGLTSEQIAALAAKLAYRVFVKDPNQCEPATDAFDNYFDLAGQLPDPNLQYIYTQVLALCGQNRQAVYMLRKIPPSAEQLYSKAQLDLISAEIASGLHRSIFDHTGYATLFLQYLHDAEDCIYLEQATTLLQSYLKEIEILETSQLTYTDTIKDSREIARFLYICTADRKRASIRAEFTSLDLNSSDEELATVGELLDAFENAGADVNMLRAQARLDRRKGNFTEAARLWAQIAKLNEVADQNPRSWQWWRAKYYQLECAAMAGNNKAEIAHAIDVLQATYKDIPSPWSAKLESLGRDCIR